MPDTHLLERPQGVESSPDGRPPNQPEQPVSVVRALARLYWMLVGNAVLYLFAVGIIQQGSERTWALDAGFWLTVGSLIVVRYVDVSRLGGATASGEPATLRDWRRYAGRLLALSLPIWIIAHVVARNIFW